MDYTKYTAEDFASDESFIRYCLKEKSKDIFFWEEWIDEHPEKYKEVASARQIIEILSFGLPKNELDEEIAKMRIHVEGYLTLEDRSLTISPNNPLTKNGHYRKSIIRIAASLVFLAISAIVIVQFTSKQADRTISTEENLIVKQNSKGEKSLIQLPDGSVIRLNSNSEIIFPENFSGNIREVTLKGEAFFEITPNPHKPFIVKVENMSVKALGTSFNVAAYSESKAIEVALVTGKVEIKINDEITKKSILEPGDGLSFLKESKKLTMGKFDPAIALAWKRGVIYFQDASWDQIIITLERWYDVEFEIKNKPAKDNLYSGQFNNQSLELILESLSFSKNFTYKIKGKEIIINFLQ